MDKDTLTKISKLNNLRPWQQEKHYVQTLILTSLSEQPLVFKGGTYLWFFYGLNRFSEDLDFTATQDLPQDLVEKTSETLSLFGLEHSTKIISQDERSLSFRISAKGPLNTSSIDLCHVYVEISKREKLVHRPIAFELNFDAYKLPTKIISGMALNEVAAEKVRAIITRNKARDAYDLAFLSKINVKFEEITVNKKLEYYSLAFSKELFYEKLGEKNEAWVQELKPYVFEKLVDFKETERQLKKWVNKTAV